MLRSVCVFCGSSSGSKEVYAQAAQDTGRMLAERGIEMIYGGGKAGLMGLAADACLAAGGRVIGVIPRGLAEKEIGHRGLTELRIVGSMHERKAIMAGLAGAFVALPGGYGTWDELCEILTWSQLGLHRKACAVLNVSGYYDPLLAMADRAVGEGFLKSVHRDLLLAEGDPVRLLDRIQGYEAPIVDKWIDRSTL